MFSVPELDGAEFEAHFLTGTRKGPAVPATVHWRLDCVTSGVTLQDWTAITPTVVLDGLNQVTDCYVTVEVPGSLNALQAQSAKAETKALLIVADKDLPQQNSKEYRYRVVNLVGRS